MNSGGQKQLLGTCWVKRVKRKTQPMILFPVVEAWLSDIDTAWCFRSSTVLYLFNQPQLPGV